MLPDGRTSFQALQNAASGGARAARSVYFVFDLLRLDGERLQAAAARGAQGAPASAGRPAQDRAASATRITSGRGRGVLRAGVPAGLEGIVSKRRDDRTGPGAHRLAQDQVRARQEFVIGGFTDPEGIARRHRRAAGRLLRRRPARFAGKVGTGFTHTVALELRRQLDAIEQKTCPFDPPPPGALGRNAHWVRPQLVGEVVFTEWTGDGKIRHPSFQGLRADKKPKEVVRERPKSVPKA